MSARARDRRGQATIEYVVVVAALLAALTMLAPTQLSLCQQPQRLDTIQCLRAVMGAQHDHLGVAVGVGDLPDVPRAWIEPFLSAAQVVPFAPEPLQHAGEDIAGWESWDCNHTPAWSTGSGPVCRIGPP